MLSYKECLDLLDLNADELAALSQHDHSGDLVEDDYRHYLAYAQNGEPMLHRKIAGELEKAEQEGDSDRLGHLKAIVMRFISDHPLHRA